MPQNLAPYRFRPGQSGNPHGRPKNRASDIAQRLDTTSPPRALCLSIGIDPKSTWYEAILYALGCAAATGNVEAARSLLPELRNNSSMGMQVNIGGTIDYDAGKSAKAILMEKLGEEERHKDAQSEGEDDEPQNSPPGRDSQHTRKP